jgi:hypothetical protein
VGGSRYSWERQRGAHQCRGIEARHTKMRLLELHLNPLCPTGKVSRVVILIAKPRLAIEIEGIFVLRTEFHSFRHTS